MTSYADRYQELFEATGRRHVRLGDIIWVPYNGMIVPFAPPDEMIAMPRGAAEELFARLPGHLIRWTTGFQTEASPWYAVIRRRRLEIDEYASKSVRNRLRRAFQGCAVRPLDLVTESEDVARVFAEAASHHGEAAGVTADVFRRQGESLRPFADIVRYHGAYLDGRLIAVSVSHVFAGHGASLSEIRLSDEARKFNRSYALIHGVSNELLTDVGYVSDGFRSILHETAIQGLMINRLHFEHGFTRLNIAYRRPVQTAIRLARPLSPLLGHADKRVEALVRQHAIAEDSRNRLYELFEFRSGAPVRAPRDGYTIDVFRPTFARPGPQGFSLAALYWFIASLGHYRIYRALDAKRSVAHSCYVVPKIFRFAFMRRSDVQIGPAFTAPAERGRGLYTWMLRTIVADVKAQAKTGRILIFAETRNAPSLRGIVRAGFERIGLIRRMGFTRSYRLIHRFENADGE